MGRVPFGYLLSVGVIAAATAFALWPRRPDRSSPFEISYLFGFLVNEAPVLGFYFLALSTLIALVEDDLDSLGGRVVAGGAAITAIGLVVLAVRGVRVAAALSPAYSANRPRVARSLLWPLATRPRRVQRIGNVAYQPGGRRHRLDIYRHRSQPPSGPTLIYFHGGAFRGGHKRRQARALFGRLAAHGWVCISANYRVREHGAFPANLHDVRRVVEWARREGDRFGVDPGAIYLAGSSAGAHLGAIAALTDRQTGNGIRGVICLGGYYGWARGDDARSSPLAHLHAGAPAFLIVHGANDTIVIAQDARDFADELSRISTARVEYLELPGAQHSFDVVASPRIAAVIDRIEEFARTDER